MKKLLLILLISTSFSACKKDADAVAPKGPAGEVAGSYELTSFRYQTKDDELVIPTLPVVQQGRTTYSGVVELTETDDPNQVNMVLSLDFDGQAESLDFEAVEVKKSGSRYNLSLDGTQIATVNGNKLSFDVKATDARLAFTATR
ncbi:hypothetical protein [Larkinella soli]|uniref:hypothetical protein n=1 Tax=Larkinella soli TaxID=1770527 RepID=UPI000FFCC43E|nr:hypothetical protein [Larkinella soli]